jgi:hypothetical protein
MGKHKKTLPIRLQLAAVNAFSAGPVLPQRWERMPPGAYGGGPDPFADPYEGLRPGDGYPRMGPIEWDDPDREAIYGR